MMCRIKKNLLLSLLEAKGHTLNTFTKEADISYKTLCKFNDGLSINKVKAEKILNVLKQLPTGDMTAEFEVLDTKRTQNDDD